MSLNEAAAEAREDMTLEERLAFNAHMIGGLLQSIDMAGFVDPGRAAVIIDAAREFVVADRKTAAATRDRSSVSSRIKFAAGVSS